MEFLLGPGVGNYKFLSQHESVDTSRFCFLWILRVEVILKKSFFFTFECRGLTSVDS